MGKRKMIQRNLLNNSVSAYFAAVEIHNKPNFPYRYETTTFLIVNAWELALKSYIRKYVRSRDIFTKDGHTISLDKAISYVEENINTIEPKYFTSMKENITLLEDYRNKVVHYYNDNLEPFVFMLVAKAALNYVNFVKKFFNKDILKDDGLFILPLGFKLPFKPEEFFTSTSVNYSPSESSFIKSMIKVIADLDKQGIQDSIVLEFNVYLDNVKNVKNKDFLVAITNSESADLTLSKRTQYQLSNDSSATKLMVKEEDVRKLFPLTHKEICKFCKEKIADFKQNEEFNNIMRQIKSDNTLSFTRKLDPNSEKSSSKTFYSEKAKQKLFDYYNSNN